MKLLLYYNTNTNKILIEKEYNDYKEILKQKTLNWEEESIQTHY